eukprot:1546600-Rhodomonas_salina.1
MWGNEACEARQSTFYKWNDPPASHAVDAERSTCSKTADASADPNPQWLRVDLEEERLVGAVRFAAVGSPADFTVAIAASDAAWVEDAAGIRVQNPSRGGALPAVTEPCAVEAAGDGQLQASCGAATKGRYVFIARASAGQSLEVCAVEVFAHVCLGPAEEEEEQVLSCGLGLQPSPCETCRGCAYCPAGTYSDKEGAYACTPCPSAGGLTVYSPPGSTSMMQCESDAFLDGTSTLSVRSVMFNQTSDSWEIVIQWTLGLRVQ